ncbi:hypothetical protein [Pseudoscardovia radai]|uniref:hypothetical protein n=1 Tax=Pseudoscardovia radai TaxID=987066 RepID=UPI001179A9EF|nr:hypothetical protein [Pseudoscardovia radai]
MDGMYRRVARRWEEEGNSEISLEIISGFSILTRNREVVSWERPCENSLLPISDGNDSGVTMFHGEDSSP